MRIDQWLPAAHRGDAIGDEALRIRDALRREGHEARVYALSIDPDVEEDVRPFPERERGGSDVVILHFALPSPLSRAFAEETARRVLVYHNITPAGFFAGLDDELARIAHEGRRELGSLAGSCELALGDSEFNRAELEALGFERTAVLPILLDFDVYRDQAPSPVLTEILEDGRANFLFVGRVFPNKRFEDLAKLAFFYKKYVSEDFRFLLVGRAGRMERYQQAVQALADRWGLRPSEFLFTGHVSFEDLVACYRSSDAFISMSEHEGFAVPLVESMLLDLPILAYAEAAVPDTLGGAGVLFRDKNYEELAEMAHLLATNEDFSAEVAASGRARLEHFRPERVESSLFGYIEEVTR